MAPPFFTVLRRVCPLLDTKSCAVSLGERACSVAYTTAVLHTVAVKGRFPPPPCSASALKAAPKETLLINPADRTATSDSHAEVLEPRPHQQLLVRFTGLTLLIVPYNLYQNVDI